MTVSPERGLVGFKNFVSAMKTMDDEGKSATQSGQGQIKAYLTRDKISGVLKVDSGPEGKKSKNINLVDLAVIMDDVAQEVLSNENLVKRVNIDDLPGAVRGLEKVKVRIFNAQQSMSPGEWLESMIDYLFGWENKYESALRKVDYALDILNSQIIPRQITDLEGKNKGLQVEVDVLNKRILQLNKDITSLSQPKKLVSLDFTPQEERKLKLEDSKKELLEKTSQLTTKQQKIVSNETSIETKKSELKRIQKKRVETSDLPGEHLVLKKKPADLSGFELNEGQYRRVYPLLGPTSDGRTGAYVRQQLRAVFGFFTGREKTIEALQKSVTDKFGAGADVEVNIKHLKKMLEGGNSADNMMYLSQYLDTLISKAQLRIPVNTKYLKSLNALQSDLKRSLPFALDASSSMTPKKAWEMSSNIKSKLKDMLPGERLLIPVGAEDHQTLLVLKKNKEGKVETNFYNTGAGLETQFDEAIHGKDFVKAVTGQLNTVPLSLKFDNPIDLNQDSRPFVSMMAALYQMPSDKSKKIGDVYSTLTEGLGDSKPLHEKKDQENGVCSFMVLDEAFEDILGDDYTQFMLELMGEVKEDFQDISDAMKKPNELTVYDALNQALLDDLDVEMEKLKRL